MQTFEETQASPYSVAWIDCLAGGKSLGRSLFHHGAHAKLAELDTVTRTKPLESAPRLAAKMPFDFPAFVLNRASVGLFNEFYYRTGRSGAALIDYDRAFFPLDAVLDWNRIYGRRGAICKRCWKKRRGQAWALSWRC
jgi:hypothetical protein